MKISFPQLTQTLRQKNFPIYLISGNEPLLIDEATAIVRHYAQKQGFNERETLHAEAGGSSWQTLASLANNLPLLPENLIIELRMPTGKPGDTGSKVLQNYAAHIPPDKILVIITDKIDASTQKTNWYKAVEKNGLVVQVWQIDAHQFPAWLVNKLKQFEMQADAAGIKLLAEHTSGNLLAASQEIEKLRLIYGSCKLSAQQILEAITDNSRFNVFSLTDSWYQNDISQIVHIMQNLRAEGVEPPIILWALTRELRMLLKLKMISDQYQLDQEIQNYRIKPAQKPLLKRFLQKHDQSSLEKILQKAAEIDLLIKGIDNKKNSGDVWQELTKLIIN